MKHAKIKDAWSKRSELRTEGRKLLAEGGKVYAEGDKFYAEGGKLYAEGGKLYAEGNKLYCDAAIVAYGRKAIIDWLTGEIEVKE